MYIYIHQYIYICVHIYICMYIYIYIQIDIYICTYVENRSMYKDIYIYVYTIGYCIHTNIHACICLCVRLHMNTYIYIYTYKSEPTSKSTLSGPQSKSTAWALAFTGKCWPKGPDPHKNDNFCNKWGAQKDKK